MPLELGDILSPWQLATRATRKSAGVWARNSARDIARAEAIARAERISSASFLWWSVLAAIAGHDRFTVTGGRADFHQENRRFLVASAARMSRSPALLSNYFDFFSFTTCTPWGLILET